MQKKNIIRRFADFIRQSFREYEKTVQYQCANNMNMIFHGPYDVRAAF